MCVCMVVVNTTCWNVVEIVHMAFITYEPCMRKAMGHYIAYVREHHIRGHCVIRMLCMGVYTTIYVVLNACDYGNCSLALSHIEHDIGNSIHGH